MHPIMQRLVDTPTSEARAAKIDANFGACASASMF
jgi:hypothetical protein